MRTRHHHERGGAIKVIIVVVVVLYGVFSAIKVVGVRSDDAALRDQTEQKLRFGAGEGKGAKELHFELLKFATDRAIPLEKEKLIVEDDKQEWHIKYDYERVVDLWIWTYQYPVNFDERKPKG